MAQAADHTHDDGTSCDVAHGDGPAPRPEDRRLVVVYATALGSYLASWGRELGFAVTLLEPDPSVVTRGHRAGCDAVLHDAGSVPIDADTDVVVTDHHRDDLGPTMAPLVRARPRTIGIIGSPRHEGPHVAALRAEGLDDAAIATVQRPIGLDIGSRTPAEIALSILGGVLAQRSGREGGLPRTAAPSAG
ncbi:MAG: XdhC family protein [Nitriliruptoraceae bacterium]|nr:XdhC family protein [Nitriliruptoraceae bacterium]